MARTWQDASKDLMGTWAIDLTRTDRGAIRPTQHNLVHILMHHPDWQGVLAYDQFANSIELQRPPPWGGGEREWTNALTAELQHWLSQPEIGIDLGEPKTLTAVLVAARRAAYNPLTDYLGSLRWDGTARLSVMLCDYWHAQQTEYTARLGANWLVAMVARAFTPGCKVDVMPILEGDQGAGKTQSLEVLAGPRFYAEISAAFGSKDLMESLRGVWLLEVGELQGLGKADKETLKRTLSCRRDRLRPAYGRGMETYERTAILVGTTNEDSYLNDPTGARRFWPVRVGHVDLDALHRDRDQLWAEAVHLYQHGDTTGPDASAWRHWWMPASAKEEQSARFQSDVWQDPVREWLDGEAPSQHYPAGDREVYYQVTSNQLLRHALEVGTDQMDRPKQMRVASILRSLGWHRERSRTEGSVREWVWRRYPGGGSEPPEGACVDRLHTPPRAGAGQQVDR